KTDKEAGIKLIKHVNETTIGVSTLLQSSQSGYEDKAESLNSYFINKNSENLSKEITEFIRKNLGFGDFVFRDASGNEIKHAATMDEFEKVIMEVPDDSLVYHTKRDHFSAWLMARGEIQIAKHIRPLKITDFDSVSALREFTEKLFKNIRFAKLRGKVVNFNETIIDEPSIIMQIQKGSMGGKGRGLAFVNALLTNSDLAEKFPEVEIRIPNTTIIGVDEFDIFMRENKLWDFVTATKDYNIIKKKFLQCSLTSTLQLKLKKLIALMKVPLAVRSSGLFEDSMTQHFSGIYDTFLIPNNHPEDSHRFTHLINAVKMIYASMFSPDSRAYFSAIHYKIEEEKMAIIIQEVVGKKHESSFYPHISGVAQSYNYYPISYMNPEDGVVVMAVGLGAYVVGGENVFRFCPAYPKVEMLSNNELLQHNQNHLYGINMDNPESDLTLGEWATLKKLDIPEAEKSGSINYSASVWDFQNQRMTPGLNASGPRILNFSHILQYDYFPLAEAIN
ncbi:MAG: pyruvate, phosphate dikinase, partial [Calditrichia bacterium]|nr:pyruvate, phosphate dikinase [Calditrichia bacterium]